MAEKYKCEKCKNIVDYTETEPNLDLGTPPEEPFGKAYFPRTHKDCGGIVELVEEK